jgi:hypothetical protein
MSSVSSLILSTVQSDYFADREDVFDRWLIALDKRRPSIKLPLEFYNSVSEYITTSLSYDIKSFIELGGFFEKLTGNLKNKVIDSWELIDYKSCIWKCPNKISIVFL